MNSAKLEDIAVRIVEESGAYRAPQRLSASDRWTLRLLRANRFIDVKAPLSLSLVKAGYVDKAPEHWFLTAAGRKAIDAEKNP